MNKYSSKAVKTAATVGMSLAMVLSNAAPVFAAGSVADACLIATEDQLNSVKRFIAQTKDVDWKTVTADSTIKVDYRFTKKAYSYDVENDEATGIEGNSVAVTKDTPYPAYITINGVTLDLYVVGSNTLSGGEKQTTTYTGEDGKYYYYATNATPEFIDGKVKVNLIDYIGGRDTITTSGVETDDVPAPAGAVDAGKAVVYSGPAAGFMTMLKDVVKGCDEATTTKAETILDVYNAVTSKNKALVTLAIDGEDEVYDQITKIEAFLEKFDGNLTYDQKETLNSALEDLYADESIDSSSDSYQTALTKFLDKATSDLEKVLTDSDYTDVEKSNAITTTTIDTWVKDIKKNASYKRFKNEDAVIEFLASVEELKDDAKVVADAVNKAKNDSYKEYAKGTNSALKAVAKITYESSKLDTKGLSIDDYTLLKDFKEDVVDMLLELREIQPEALPINFLLPIKGTPLGNADISMLTTEYCMKVLCLARLLVPKADIRCAAGREVYFKGEEKKLLSVVDSIFASGYLTESGQGIQDTIQTILDAGFTYEIESA